MPDPLHPAVVLVADRTLSADYRILLEGMLGTMQTTRTPSLLMRTLLARRLKVDAAGRAGRAPLGIRRMEASLVHAGVVSADQVVCTTPEGLARLLGSWVKVVGVSSGDPLGVGMSNSTTEALFGGKLYSRLWTDGMLSRIRAAKAKYGFRVIGGGPGAWQWRTNPAEANRQGIDCVFEGYFESQGPELFRRMLAGADADAATNAKKAHQPPQFLREEGTCIQAVQPILAPAALGAVEISRGCGRGCRFCLSAQAGMAHLPLDTILADLQTNARGDLRSAVLGSEDFFRYGATGPAVQFERLIGLLQAVGKIDGISLLQIDHANVSSIVQLTAQQLRQVRSLLVAGRRVEHPWLNIGVESASGRLVHANAPGKIAPFRPEDWETLVRQAAALVAEAGFFPVFSLVLGLPGETPDDVHRTIRLVADLTARPASIFPIFYEPLPDRGGADRFGVAQLWPEHLELLSACYEANFRWVPPLFRDNQRAAGSSWPRRAIFQALGLAQVPLWRSRFRAMGKQIERRGAVQTPTPVPSFSEETAAPIGAPVAQVPGTQRPPEASGGRSNKDEREGNKNEREVKA